MRGQLARTDGTCVARRVGARLGKIRTLGACGHVFFFFVFVCPFSCVLACVSCGVYAFRFSIPCVVRCVVFFFFFFVFFVFSFFLRIVAGTAGLVWRCSGAWVFCLFFFFFFFFFFF